MCGERWAAVLLVVLLAAACGRSVPDGSSACEPYDPPAAKRTFDGRVGRIAFANDHGRSVRLEAYHPDGDGSAELHWTVPAHTAVDLGGGFGSDWGIRADNGCVVTVARVAKWAVGQFSIKWQGGRLMPGNPHTKDLRQFRAEEER